jgi:C4-dicarboxylate-specific signal transduction histidine kinase
VHNYIHEEHHSQLNDLLSKACDDRLNEECEIRLKSKRTIKIVCTSSGSNNECLATLIDLTGQKKIEEALAEKKHLLETLNETLEQRIFQAVNELREKDQMLIQQGRLAAMGEMINNIAHQWRQPLNNIGLIIQNLQLSFEMGDLASVDVNKQVGNAMEIILHMSRTIDDFRKFFNQDKEKQRFCVQGAVDRVLEFIGPSLRSNSIQVEVKADPNVCAVGYENEYAQVLLNILANARDAFVERKISEPKIIIKVSQPKGRSVVAVRDNGGGIAEDVLPKVFDPYFTTKKQANSSGIGLYMSKTIIEKNMCGKLSIRNVQDGAEMRIEV